MRCTRQLGGNGTFLSYGQDCPSCGAGPQPCRQDVRNVRLLRASRTGVYFRERVVQAGVGRLAAGAPAVKLRWRSGWTLYRGLGGTLRWPGQGCTRLASLPTPTLVCVVLKAHVGFLGRDRLFLRVVTSFVSFILALPILRRCGDGQVAVTEPILGAVL